MTATNEGVRRTSAGFDETVLLPRDDERRPVVSVVMPTLNEEAGIAECIERVKSALAELDVTGEIIVSDSSTDRTAEIATEHGAFVVSPDEPGYGYAYRYAFEYIRGEFVVIGDADTTYDFAELPNLFEIVADGEADVVMGSRLEGEIRPGSMPRLHQYVGNPLLTKFLNTFYGAGVSDAHSGFRVFHREVIDALSLRTNGMEFASEMVMAAGANDLHIAEVPITYHERIGEATLSSFRDGWRHVKFMLLNAPGFLFSAPAVVLSLAGIVTMAASLLGGSVAGITVGTHTAIAGSLLAIVGYRIGGLAAFSAVASDPIRPQRDPITAWLERRFRTDHGVTVGLVLTVLGSGYALYLIAEWMVGGYGQRTLLATDMLAFTAIAVGAQTVFDSFFLDILRQRHEQDEQHKARVRDEDERPEQEGHGT